MTHAEIEAELQLVEAAIDAAYWAFTRQARAKPPSLVVPQAYRRRTELELARAALRSRGRRRKVL